MEIRPGWLIAVLALLGGAITALVASASMRSARCLELAVRTPPFATRFITTTWPACALLNATMLLPPWACIMWVSFLSCLLVCLSFCGTVRQAAGRLYTQRMLCMNAAERWGMAMGHGVAAAAALHEVPVTPLPGITCSACQLTTARLMQHVQATLCSPSVLTNKAHARRRSQT